MPTARGRRLAVASLGVLRTVVLLALLAVFALAGAGVVAAFSHVPGSPERAELTWAADAALSTKLDDATARLRSIADEVDALASEGRTALAEITDSDPSKLKSSLDRGTQLAATIQADATALHDQVAALPGDAPTAAMQYSNAVLYRRSTILAALDAAMSLAGDWNRVTARALDAAKLTALINTHDATVLEAAASGRSSKFLDAIGTLDQARVILDEIAALRVQLIAGSDDTVLDEWITRSRNYDVALEGLYAALHKSKGRNTLEVQDAYGKERAAFAALPPDFRTIVVIVSEVARGGLNDAVLSIEDARGRIDEALETAEPSPSP